VFKTLDEARLIRLMKMNMDVSHIDPALFKGTTVQVPIEDYGVYEIEVDAEIEFKRLQDAPVDELASLMSQILFNTIYTQLIEPSDLPVVEFARQSATTLNPRLLSCQYFSLDDAPEIATQVTPKLEARFEELGKISEKRRQERKDTPIAASSSSSEARSRSVNSLALMDALLKKSPVEFITNLLEPAQFLDLIAENTETPLLLEALKSNRTLTVVNLNLKDVNEENSLALAHFVSQNHSLCLFKLIAKSINYEGAQVLVQALKDNGKLNRIEIKASNIYSNHDDRMDVMRWTWQYTGTMEVDTKSDAVLYNFTFSHRSQNPFKDYQKFISAYLKKYQDGMTAQELLYAACSELNYDKAFSAIKQGANVNEQARHRPTDAALPDDRLDAYHSPLSLVAMKSTEARDDRQLRLTALLLSHGADTDLLDRDGKTFSPLHWAIYNHNARLCYVLINHALENQKALVNLSNTAEDGFIGGDSPLLLAIKTCSYYNAYLHDCTVIATQLIEAGADVNATDSNLQSPLHWAAFLRLPASFLDLLLENGACYSQDKFHKTPAMLYEARPDNFIKLLPYYGRTYQPNSILGSRAENYNAEVAAMLKKLESSMEYARIERLDPEDLNQPDEMGRTLLHRAVFYGKSAEVELLLRKGCDTSIKDHTDLTALALAESLIKRFQRTIPAGFFGRPEASVYGPGNQKRWADITNLLRQHEASLMPGMSSSAR